VTKVKICGITNLDDALIASDAGADMLGFNFYEKSPRFISPADAKEIIEKLPRDITTVGVFVNSSLAEVEAVSDELSLDLVQLHGDEDCEFVDRLRKATHAKVIKVVRVSENFKPDIALEYEADHFMLDTDSRAFGGSGETFDWESAIKFKELHPDIYLAGGLTPDNVAEAVRKVMPSAVDVCSGVESAKGIKDPVKVRAFVKNAKNAL
jgi:phosphoribosylanthranilate isomerase